MRIFKRKPKPVPKTPKGWWDDTVFEYSLPGQPPMLSRESDFLAPDYPFMGIGPIRAITVLPCRVRIKGVWYMRELNL